MVVAIRTFYPYRYILILFNTKFEFKEIACLSKFLSNWFLPNKFVYVLFMCINESAATDHVVSLFSMTNKLLRNVR